ncbi:MAG: hypothetical protein Ta2A_11970 [Treponemataceae bacterium]|nr:MAG: hypothetical protein Ta2A_11970 [Treponemataceae bacterium]
MGVNPVIFASAGRRTEHFIPGVYSRSTAMPNSSGGVSASNLCIMGKSNSGKPKTLLSFSSLGEAEEVVDSALLKAIAYAFSPAPGYAPQRIFAMRVNPGTQSTCVLEKSGNPYMSVKPFLWGITANNAALSVVDGTEAGTKKIELRYNGGTDSIDNIAHAPLRIKYTGSLTNPTLTIQDNKFTVKANQTTTTRQQIVDLVYADNSIGTVDELVAALVSAGQAVTIGAAAGVDVERLESLDAVDISQPKDCRFASGIKIEYTEELDDPTVTVTDTGLSLALGGIEQQAITWTDAPTVADLVTAINNVSGFIATAIDGTMPTYLIDAANEIILTEDDTVLLSRVAFTITGSGNTPLLTIGNTETSITALVSDTVTVTLLDADFADYPLIGDLYAAIQAVPGLEVEIEDEEVDADDAARLLDWHTETPIGAGWFNVRADGFAFVEALKMFNLLDPDTPALIAPYMDGFPDNVDLVQFEGGANGEYNADAWNEALAAIAKEDIQIIATASSDPAVHTLIRNHCETCSTTQNRRERKCWLGGAIGQTPEQAMAEAKALNSSVVSLAYPSIKANNPLSGARESVDAGYYACMLAGLESALDIHIPATNKQMNVVEWGVKLTNTQIEKLIMAGVCVGGLDADENLVNIRAVTTWQGHELQLCENSMVREDHYLNRDLRRAFNQAIGDGSSDGDSASDIATLLQQARQWAGLKYIIPRGADNVWGISLKVNGDTTEITFNRNLAAPRNFVFITARNYVYTTETTVSV